MNQNETIEKTPVSTPWSPPQLRMPSSSGATGALKFAFFAEKRRLLVESEGALVLYDCGDHQVTAIRAEGDRGDALIFTSQYGDQQIGVLRRLD